MKVLFVYSDLFPTFINWKGGFYNGIGSLSASLKTDGHETSMIHVTQKFRDRDEFLSRVSAFSPNLIAFSSTTLTFNYVKELAGWLHESGSAVPVISGGIHSTLFPREVVEVPGIDMACAGEGELSLRALAKALEEGRDTTKIMGVWTNSGGTIHENGTSPLVHDLDDLPYADRSIFDYPNLASEKEGKGVFMASRGCPYHCTYCSNRLLQSIYAPGKPKDYVRFRSVGHLLGEIKQVLGEYSFIKALHFDDDVFFLKREWAEEFTERYKKEIGMPFTCNMRPNHLNAKIAGLLREAGCKEVKIGLESGNEYIRNSVLKRNITDRQMYDAFGYLKDAGIKVHTYNMVGLPFETCETMLDTVKMNARAGSDKMQISIFYPMPKTELYDICLENGFTTEGEQYDFFSTSLKIDTLNSGQISFFHKNFRFIVAVYRSIYRLDPHMTKVLESLLDRALSNRGPNVMGAFLNALRKVRNIRRSGRNGGGLPG